jgi:DHA2 family multidrug resistance protein
LRAAGSDPVTAGQQALACLYGEIQRHAATLAFLDDFRLISILLFAIIPLLVLMKGTKVR